MSSTVSFGRLAKILRMVAVSFAGAPTYENLIEDLDEDLANGKSCTICSSRRLELCKIVAVVIVLYVRGPLRSAYMLSYTVEYKHPSSPR